MKPTYACNFRCKYCYLDNSVKKNSENFDIEFAKDIISQVKLAKSSTSSVNKKIKFIWHGGEPLLWGIDNYRKIFAFMAKELSEFDYKNIIQTNLSLIDGSYIDLFLENDVQVGFSIDGPAYINDLQRVGINGNGTFFNIMEKVKLCKESGLKLGCIVVGTRKHIGKMGDLYEFMSDNGLNFKFNPVFSSGEARCNKDDYGVTADEYANMVIELFDLWYNDTRHQIVESNFIEIASNLFTGRVESCMFGKNCQEHFVAISPEGDVLPCGRFGDTELRKYAYGNLHKDELVDVLRQAKNTEMYKRAEYIESTDCGKCRFFSVCHGGCLHDGFLRSGDFKSKSFLCSAYKKIFSHIMDRMAGLVKHSEGMASKGILLESLLGKDSHLLVE